MEILSNVYKHHVKWLLVGVGLVVALTFNVDAIGAAKQLYPVDGATSLPASSEVGLRPVPLQSLQGGNSVTAQEGKHATPPRRLGGRRGVRMLAG